MVQLAEGSPIPKPIPVRLPAHEQRGPEPDIDGQEVIKRWHAIDDDLIEDRRHYWTNYFFYRGLQWLRWDYNNRTPMLAGERTASTERLRVTVNQILPRVQRLVGRLAERDLFFDVQASAADDATLAGSRLAMHVLETRRKNDDWESIREQNILNDLFGGTAAISVDWDDQHRGRLWNDAETGQLLGEGEAVLTPWSIASFGLEPGSVSRDEARWWIGCRVLPPEQVQAYYDLPEKPRADGNQMYSPLQQKLLTARVGRRKPEQLCCVYIMYERPNQLCPEGRVLHVVNGNVVQRLDQWPFPFRHLNIEVFRMSSLPDSYRGHTPVTDAVKLQVQYNHIESNLLEHTKLCGNARLWVPHGAVDEEEDLTDEPGEIIFYHPDAGTMPAYTMPAPLPRSLTQQKQEKLAEIDDILYSHDVSRGIAPGDRTSGLAVATLAEHNDSPLGPWARRENLSWARTAKSVLQLYEANARGYRKAVVVDERKIPHIYDWNGERLRGQHEVTVPKDVTLPQSRAVNQARIAELAGQFPAVFAQMDAKTLARVLDLSDEAFVGQVLDANANLAQWENARMVADEVLLPQEWHNHAVHIAEHNDLRNSPEYHFLPDETKQMIDLHIQSHQRYEEEQAAQQAQLNAMSPGLAGLPQAGAPTGSAIPLPAAQQAAIGPGKAA